jgi:hypothetical protein
VADDQHDRRRVSGRRGQIKCLDGAIGLEFENLCDLRREGRLINRCGIQHGRLLKFHLESIVHLAVVAKLPREMKTLRILEDRAGIQKGPNAPTKRVRLIFEFLRLAIIEFLFDNGRQGREAFSIGKCADPAAALFCRPQLVNIEVGKCFYQQHLERVDSVIIRVNRRIIWQIEVRLVFALPN